jgi:radical SAM enzyme (TIGR01210 family)
MNSLKDPSDQIENQILDATRWAQKDYKFNEAHDPNRPADLWFQESGEGQILFVVFYTQACRWSRCLGCNLPTKMSRKHVSYRALMAQIDWLFSQPEVIQRYHTLKKVIVSNNGSVLDEKTFSSTALMYLIAKLNLHLPNLSVLTLETRVEYVDPAELEFMARALQEGETPTNLELAIGFEAFDEHIRNGLFNKGLSLERLEGLCGLMAPYGYQLKCYLMQKPVPGMTDEQAIQDIHQAIDYLSRKATQYGVRINLHLNPTYAAFGTALERSFRKGEYSPPRLSDVARAALHGEGKDVSIFLGLSDENLAVEGGSFIRPGDEVVIEKLEQFNRIQNYSLLREVAASGSA